MHKCLVAMCSEQIQLSRGLIVLLIYCRIYCTKGKGRDGRGGEEREINIVLLNFEFVL